jgi:hypothetical protein
MKTASEAVEHRALDKTDREIAAEGHVGHRYMVVVSGTPAQLGPLVQVQAP